MTEADRGIGKWIERAVAGHGADAALAARVEDAIRAPSEELEPTLGVEALAVSTDIRETDAVTAVAEAVSDLGNSSVEVLVANAGANFHAGVAGLSDNAWGTLVDINLNETYRTCHAFADVLVGADQGRPITLAP